MASGFGRSSGSRALDLVNTLDWRDDPSRQVELLPTPGALAAWSRHEGFTKDVCGGIRLEHQRARAIKLRETIALLVRAMVDRQPPPPEAARRLSALVRDGWDHRDLTGRGRSLNWAWKKGTDPADQVLYELALDAAALLVSPERDRLRICAGEGCGWFFIDRSKAGRRRWCNMAACGNRVKVRRYRKRAARARD
jgi:predicted RNA-binding Zn ribbon-like protein